MLRGGCASLAQDGGASALVTTSHGPYGSETTAAGDASDEGGRACAPAPGPN